jgi:hypothetical protein
VKSIYFPHCLRSRVCSCAYICALHDGFVLAFGLGLVLAVRSVLWLMLWSYCILNMTTLCIFVQIAFIVGFFDDGYLLMLEHDYSIHLDLVLGHFFPV